MKKVFLFLLIVACGVTFYYVYWRGDGEPEVILKYTIEQQGNKLKRIATSGESAVYFIIGPRLEGTYMLFGTNVAANELADAWLSGIPLDIARSLLKRYPDLEYCGSKGSKEAQARVIGVGIVTDRKEFLKRLRAIDTEFDKRLRSDGKRLCTKISGPTIWLDSTEKGGRVYPFARLPGTSEDPYVFVDGLEMFSCP
jgi:hypothetical protein